MIKRLILQPQLPVVCLLIKLMKINPTRPVGLFPPVFLQLMWFQNTEGNSPWCVFFTHKLRRVLRPLVQLVASTVGLLGTNSLPARPKLTVGGLIFIPTPLAAPQTFGAYKRLSRTESALGEPWSICSSSPLHIRNKSTNLFFPSCCLNGFSLTLNNPSTISVYHQIIVGSSLSPFFLAIFSFILHVVFTSVL